MFPALMNGSCRAGERPDQTQQHRPRPRIIHPCQLRLEVLEDRTLLSGIDYGRVPELLQPLVDNTLQPSVSQQFANAANLPIIGNQLQLQSNHVLSSLLDQIAVQLGTAKDTGNPEADIQHALGSLVIVEPATQYIANGVAVEFLVHQSVCFSGSLSQVEMKALAGFLSVQGTSQGPSVTVGFDFLLQFSYTNNSMLVLGLPNGMAALSSISNAPPINAPLAINLAANSIGGTPFQFKALVNGLLTSTVTDKGDSGFVASVGVNLDARGNASSPFLAPNSRLHLDVQLDSGLIPGQATFNIDVTSQLTLDWQFNNTDLNATLDAFGTISNVQFSGVGIRAKDFGVNFLTPVIQKIQAITAPFEPIASILNSAVPGLTIFGIKPTLAQVLDIVTNSGSLIEDIAGSIDGINKLNLNPNISDNQFVTFGDFKLVDSSSGGSLTPADLDARNFRIPDGTHFNPPSTTDLNVYLNQAEQVIKGLSFPIVEAGANGQAPAVFNLLQGRDVSFFQYNDTFGSDKALTVGPIPLFSIGFVTVGIKGTVGFKAVLDTGYDTAGVRKYLGDPQHDTGDLANGFYLKTDTGLKITAGMDLYGSVVIATVNAGIRGEIDFTLGSYQADPSGKIRLDDPNLAGNLDDPLSVFDINGKISLVFRIDVGFDVGPIHVTLFSFNLPEIPIFDFSTARHPSQPNAKGIIDLGILSGDHNIDVHEYKHRVTDQLTEGGIEIDDNGAIKRYPTTDIWTDSTGTHRTVLTSYHQIDIQFQAGTNHRVTVEHGVVGDEVTFQPVDAEILDGSGASPNSQDDFEYYASGQAVMVGGPGNSNLTGGTWEFGGGVPVDFVPENEPDFPKWAAEDVGPLAVERPLQAGDGDDKLTGSGHLYGGSGNNIFYGSGQLFGGGSLAELGLYTMPGDQFYFKGGRNDFYLHPALDQFGFPTGADTVYGGNGGQNYLEYIGVLANLSQDGPNSNIIVGPNPFGMDDLDAHASLTLSDVYPGGSPTQYSLSALDIDYLSVELGGGNISLGYRSSAGQIFDLSDTSLQGMSVWDTKPEAGVHVMTYGRPEANDHYNIFSDGQEGLAIHNERFDPVRNGFIEDSPPLDIQGLAANGVSHSSVTLAEGNGFDTVRVTEANLVNEQVILTVQGGGNGPTDTLILDDSALRISATWDIEGSAVTRTYEIYDAGTHKYLFVNQTVHYSNIAELDIDSGKANSYFEFSPDGQNLDELPGAVNLSPNGGNSEIDVFDQSSHHGEGWSIAQFGVTRTSDFAHGAPFVLRTLSYAPPVNVNSQLQTLVIDGGVGGSTFALTNFNGTSGGDLDFLPASVTLNGAGNPKDTLIADDSQNNSDNIVWKVSGTNISRTFPAFYHPPGTHYGDASIDYSQIANLVLRGSAPAKTYILSPDRRNLDELPANVTIQDQNAGSRNNQLLVNDQDSQPEYWPALPRTTSWFINGTMIQRTNYIKGEILGAPIDVAVAHTITHDAQTVTSNGGLAGNNFLVHPWSIGALTIAGGTGSDALTIDDRDGTGFSQWDLSVTRATHTIPGDVPIVFPINYFGLGSMEVDGENAGASFTLEDPGVVLTTIDMGPAPDAVQVNGLSGLLTVKGAAPSGLSSSLNTININNAPVILSPAAAAYISSHFAVNSSFVFLDNQSTEPRTGLFQDSQGHTLSPGSVFLAQGLKLELLTYTGDDGNKDVDLNHLNAPPSISNLAFQPIEVAPSALTATIDDPDLTDMLTVTVDWGDHSQPGVYHLPGGSKAFSTSHSYPEETTVAYHILVAVSDGHPDGTASAALWAAVGDAPLQLLSVGNSTASMMDHPELFPTERQSFSGIITQFNDPGSDGTVQDYSAMVTWGDGSTPTKGTVMVVNLFDGLRRFVVQGSHTFAEQGKYTLHVDITDVGGSKLSASGTEIVRDAPLQAQGQNGQVAVNEKFNGIVASFTDPGGDGTVGDYLANIDWGDSQDAPFLGTIQANGSNQFSVYGSHRYHDRGSYTVTIEIDDVGGSTVTVTGTIVVGVVPPPGARPGRGGQAFGLGINREAAAAPGTPSQQNLEREAVAHIMSDPSHLSSAPSMGHDRLGSRLIRTDRWEEGYLAILDESFWETIR